MGLGIALGAYTNEYNNQRRMRRDDETHDMQKEQFGWARDDREQASQLRASKVAELDAMRRTMAALDNPLDEENYAYLREQAKQYGFGDVSRMGNTLGQFTPDEASGQTVFHPLDMNATRGMVQNYYMQRLGTLDPDSAAQFLAGERQHNYNVGRDAVRDNQWQLGYGLQESRLNHDIHHSDRTFNHNVNQDRVRNNQWQATFDQNSELHRARVDALSHPVSSYVDPTTGAVVHQMRDGNLLNADGSPFTGDARGLAQVGRAPMDSAEAQLQAALAIPENQQAVVNVGRYVKAAAEHRNNPEVSKRYTTAALQAVMELPPVVQMQVMDQIVPQLPDDVGNVQVKVKRTGRDGTEYELTLPLSQANPELYQTIKTEQRLYGGTGTQVRDPRAGRDETAVERVQRRGILTRDDGSTDLVEPLRRGLRGAVQLNQRLVDQTNANLPY